MLDNEKDGMNEESVNMITLEVSLMVTQDVEGLTDTRTAKGPTLSCTGFIQCPNKDNVAHCCCHF